MGGYIKYGVVLYPIFVLNMVGYKKYLQLSLFPGCKRHHQGD